MVTALIEDPLLLGLWGFLRLAPRPMMLAEISRTTHVDAAIAQRKLDVLGIYELVEAIPAATRRPGISYRARYLGLRIRSRHEGDHALLHRIADTIQRHSRDLLPSDWPPSAAAAAAGTPHARFSGVFNLTPPEAEELRRRLNTVAEYADLLSQKYAKRGTIPELCNYGVQFRVEPLPAPALPPAPVRIVLGGTDASESPPAPERPAGGRLSARERETALALARGLTMAQVAQELRLARSTVSTLTKRVYRKLGAHRRAEMVTRLNELGLMP